MDFASLAQMGNLGMQLLDLGNQHSKDNASHNAINNALEYLKNNTAIYPDAMRDQNRAVIDQMIPTTLSLYGDLGDVSAQLRDARAGINGIDPYKASSFDYTKEISDFYDPAFRMSVDNANQSVNESQALGGNLFSSDTAQKIAAENQALAAQMYSEALKAYQTDKGMEQGIWAGNDAARQAEANSRANLAQTKYNVASDNAANLNSAYNDYYRALMQLNEDYWANRADYDSARIGLTTQDPGKNYGIFSDLGGIFGI